MTDQDVAFAIAQWCSGITQKEIGRHFGYKNGTGVCNGIMAFIRKYYPDVSKLMRTHEYYNGATVTYIDQRFERKDLAKIAFCHFMAQREDA